MYTTTTAELVLCRGIVGIMKIEGSFDFIISECEKL